MQFHQVSERELPILYRLNRRMAESEGQGELFTAKYASYRQVFDGDRPPVRAWLLTEEEEVFGFIIWQEKFASYMGRMALYVEDLWLEESHRDSERQDAVLDELLQRAEAAGYCRVEIRRLEWKGIDAGALAERGFAPVEKWRIWRKELER